MLVGYGFAGKDEAADPFGEASSSAYCASLLLLLHMHSSHGSHSSLGLHTHTHNTHRVGYLHAGYGRNPTMKKEDKKRLINNTMKQKLLQEMLDKKMQMPGGGGGYMGGGGGMAGALAGGLGRGQGAGQGAGGAKKGWGSYLTSMFGGGDASKDGQLVSVPHTHTQIDIYSVL